MKFFWMNLFLGMGVFVLVWLSLGIALFLNNPLPFLALALIIFFVVVLGWISQSQIEGSSMDESLLSK